jgi:protoheme IX farnesyltransferase
MFLWTPPHFWSLAAARRDDYAAAGVPMLPVAAPEGIWTLAILLHTAVLVPLSLVPLGFGLGPIYGVAAATGGGYFLWRSWQLYRAPARHGQQFRHPCPIDLLIVGVAADKAVDSS